jgi:uncharacterized protein (TIRG00374 family)
MKSFPFKKVVSIIIKTGVSIGVLLFLFRHIDPGAIAAALGSYPPATVFAAIGLYALFALWTAMKWKLLLPRCDFGIVMKISLARYFYSLIGLGAVTGDAARVYMLGKREKDAGGIAASVIADRVTGLIALIAMGILGILFSTKKVSMAIPLLCSLLLGFLLSSVFFLRLSGLYAFVKRNAEYFFRVIKAPGSALEETLRCLDALYAYSKQSRLLFLSIAAGIVSQSLCIACCCLLGNHLGMRVPFGDWCWIFCLVSMAVLLPLSISGLGIREGSFVGLLALWGIGPAKAMALSLSLFCLDAVLGAIGALSHIGMKTRAK